MEEIPTLNDFSNIGARGGMHAKDAEECNQGLRPLRLQTFRCSPRVSNEVR